MKSIVNVQAYLRGSALLMREKCLSEAKLCPFTPFLTLKRWVVLALLLMVGTGCAVNPVTGRSELALMKMSTADEVQLGMYAFPAAIQQMGGEVPDLQLQGYVQKVGSLVAKAGHRPGLDYQFRVVNQPAPNAFALPGGYVAITRGLIVQLENEAQLAAVLGHEVAHVTARHAVQAIQRGQLAQLTATLLGQLTAEERYGKLALQAGLIGSQLLENSFSRDQEREADRLGIDYMVAAGYDPQGAIALQELFYRKLDQEQQPDWLENLFRTHPFSKERLDNNRRYVHTTYAGVIRSPGAYIGKEDYAEVIRYVHETEPGYQLYSQAQFQEAAGEPNLAIQTLHEALKSAPDEALIHAEIGLAYLRQEDLLSARRYFKQAIALDSDYYQSHLGLGYVYLKRDEYSSATTSLERSRELLATTQALYLLGEAFYGSGQSDKAVESYREVVEADPGGRLGQAAAKRLAEIGGR